MKIVISYTVLVALAIAQALPIDNGHVNPGLDATPKYSPLIDGDSAAVNISCATFDPSFIHWSSQSPEARARMPSGAGSRPPPRVERDIWSLHPRKSRISTTTRPFRLILEARASEIMRLV
ncbi:hypothetical protein B0H11DRAFT_1906181 [Mycena galericulata]|nr:hypothetical protein B0H11DRAFT_1906181 [Mycena galericulata]